MEATLNTKAEVILEALSRASDLTLRGVRGIIAEAVFAVEIAKKLDGWTATTPPGNPSYDVALDDGKGQVRIQVKMQRKLKQQPLVKNGMFIVETQKTRSGEKAGKATRPYGFGDFDILAVCMEPSTRSWTDFRYTLCRWLLPRPDDSTLLRVLQPVSPTPNGDWTDDLRTCLGWLRSRIRKQIAERVAE